MIILPAIVSHAHSKKTVVPY